jgi:hypothetical protein
VVKHIAARNAPLLTDAQPHVIIAAGMVLRKGGSVSLQNKEEA